MAFVEFYIQVVERAISGSLDWAQAVVFLIGVGIAFFERRGFSLHGISGLPSDRGFWLSVVLVVVCVRLAFAPFWMWQEEHAARSAADTRAACLADQVSVKKDRASKRSQLETFYVQGGNSLTLLCQRTFHREILKIL